MPTCFDPPFARPDRTFTIDLQSCHCCPTTCRHTYQNGAVLTPLEVVVPILCSRVIQGNCLIRFGINPCQSIVLKTVATRARQAQVLLNSLTTYAFGDNVVYFHLDHDCLGSLAVFAQTFSASCDEFAQP